jgi:hypothetical protein
MEQAKVLRRTISRLAKMVEQHSERISVNVMLDLSAQIKRSASGSHCYYVELRQVLLFDFDTHIIIFYTPS